MRNCLRVQGAFVATLFVSVSIAEQPPSVESPARPRSNGWKEYASEEGKFIVNMPGKPKQVKTVVPSVVGNLNHTMVYVFQAKEGRKFTVHFSKYPPGANYGDETFDYKVLDKVVSGVTQARKGELQKKSKIKLGKYHGLNCLIDLPKTSEKVMMRAYMVENRLYQLSGLWSTSDSEGSVAIEKFITSFKLMD